MSFINSLTNALGFNQQEDPTKPKAVVPPTPLQGVYARATETGNKNAGFISTLMQKMKEPQPKTVSTDTLENVRSIVDIPASLGRALITRPAAKVLKTFQQGAEYLDSFEPIAKSPFGTPEKAPVIPKTGGAETYTPKTPVEQAIFGKEPIKNYVQESKDLIQMSKDIQQPVTDADGKVIFKGIDKKIAIPLAFFGSLGGPLADLTPGGGEKKQVAEGIFKGVLDDIIKTTVNVTDDASAFRLLKEAGIEDDIARESAPLLTAAKDTQSAETAIREVAAKQLQVTEQKVAGRIKELEDKKAGVATVADGTKMDIAPVMLNADEVDELRFLQENKNKPANIIAANSATKPVEEVVPRERGYITSAKASDELASEIKSELYGIYDEKANKDLVERATARITENMDEAKNFAMTQSTDEAIATGVSLAKQYSDEIAKASSQAEKVKIGKEAAAVINKQAETLTEAGRTVQAASLLGPQTPEGMLRKAAQKIKEYNKKNPGRKVPELTGENVVDILDKGKATEKMPEGLAKDVAKKQLADTLESLIPSPMWKKITSVWKAGLLTGIKTHGVNTAANFFQGVAENVKNVPAVGIDMATSLITGQRTKALSLRGIVDGTTEGFKKGYDYLRTGVSKESAESALEFGKLHYDSKPGKIVQAYADAVYRILGAEDMPFFYGAFRRSLGEQALVTIKNEGLEFASKAEKEAWIKNFMDNPPKAAMELADQDAKIATFRNDTDLGKGAKAIQDFKIMGIPVGEIVLPFAKTPSAVATAMINYTPVGAVANIAEMLYKRQFNQKQFAEAVGRSVTGFGALWLGSELYNKNLISLGYPKDEKERAKWEATGKTPNSVRIGDKWYPLTTFGPIGNVMSIGGYVQKGREETGSTAGGVFAGFTGAAKNLTEQTFLTGVKNIIDAVNDPEKGGVSYVGSSIASIVPTIVSDMTQAFDKYQRKSSGTILGPLKARVPGLRTTLPKKLDVWGQHIERNRSAVGTAISPIRLSNTIQGTLNTEVERLGQLGEDVRPTKLDAQIKNVKLTDKEQYVYQRLYGNILTKSLNALISNPEYQKLDPEKQAEAWKDMVTKLRAAAADLMLPVLMMKRYELGDEFDPKMVAQITNTLYKKSPDFAKASPEKQKKVILKILSK